MKQLTNKQPLCFLLQNSHLVTSLPFIDEQLDVPKSKILYLIRAEQETMKRQPKQYIKDLVVPTLDYADSDHFKKQVERVQAKIAQRQQEKAEGKIKKKEATYPEPPKKLVSGQHQRVSSLVNQGILNYENTICKNVNLQIYKKYGPLVLKELIEVLDKERNNLLTLISDQKSQLETINQNRKYEQTQSYQRQYDIGERVKIMLNKRKKVE